MQAYEVIRGVTMSRLGSVALLHLIPDPDVAELDRQLSCGEVSKDIPKMNRRRRRTFFAFLRRGIPAGPACAMAVRS